VFARLSAGRDATALRQAGCPPLRKSGGNANINRTAVWQIRTNAKCDSNCQAASARQKRQPPSRREGGRLAQSKTLREYQWSRSNAPAFWSAAALRRFFLLNLLKDYYLSFINKNHLTNGIDGRILRTMNVNEISPKANPRLKRIQKISAFLRTIFFVCAVWFGLLGILGMYYFLCVGYAVEFWFSYKLFSFYARGDLFTPKVVRYMQWIGITSILVGIWSIYDELSMSVNAGYLKYAPSSGWEIISWFQHVFSLLAFNLLLGFVIIFVAWIMDEGRQIQEEQELTV
jgi:hypothetical protein